MSEFTIRAIVTTNDNLRALGFYPRCGFVFKEVRIGAVTEARRTLKAEIPLVSDNGFRFVTKLNW